MTNCTFSGNSGPFGGGGIFNAGALTVTNTILAASPSGGNCAAGFGVTDGGQNIDDGTTCGFSAANGSLSSTNPQLDPAGLRNNGGPTQTIALCTAPGTPALCTGRSPAINAADNATCSNPPVSGVDQRDLTRFPAGDPTCDIGAFEVQPLGSPAPVLSPAGLIGLVILLSGAGWLALRRPARL